MRRLFALLALGALLSASVGSVQASGQGIPLESLPLIGGNGCVISAACPGKVHGVVLTRGLHIDGSTHQEIRLGKRFVSLAGTIYLDDASSDANDQINIYDMNNGDKQAIYTVTVWSGRPISFAIGVRGVDSIDINPGGYPNSIDVVAQVAPAAPAVQPQASRGAAIAVVLPGANVYLSGVPLVPFAWKPYGGAAAYFLQVWLTRAAPGQKITVHSRINFATTTTDLHYELATASMPRGTYHWRIAALSAAGALISQWTPEEIINLS